MVCFSPRFRCLLRSFIGVITIFKNSYFVNVYGSDFVVLIV